MSSVEEIKAVITQLPREQLLQLADWLQERYHDAWDYQMKANDESGGVSDGG